MILESCLSESRRKITISSIRLRNSGRKCARSASWTWALILASSFSSRIQFEPIFEVTVLYADDVTPDVGEPFTDGVAFAARAFLQNDLDTWMLCIPHHDLAGPVGYHALKERAQASRDRSRSGNQPAAFIELPLPAPTARIDYLIELEDGRGAKMTLRLAPGSGSEVLALAQAFWRRQP